MHSKANSPRASGISIFLSTLNLLLGILTLSYLHPKKDGEHLFELE